MGGGSQTSSSSQSQQNSLPSWLTGAYQSQLGNIGSLLGQDQSQLSGAPALLGSGINSISGVNPQSIGAADSSLSNVLGGNYLSGAQSAYNASNPLLAQQASGSLLDVNSNPYLQGSYNQALQGIQNNVDSQFGAAGRNVLASAPVQADQAATLANQLYGGQYATNLNATQNAQNLVSGNYNTGVGQLNNAAAISPGVTSGLYTQGNQLLSAGQTPNNLQSWYSSLLGQTAAPFGQSTGTGTSTVQNNPSLLSQIGGGVSALGLLGAFI